MKRVLSLLLVGLCSCNADRVSTSISVFLFPVAGNDSEISAVVGYLPKHHDNALIDAPAEGYNVHAGTTFRRKLSPGCEIVIDWKKGQDNAYVVVLTKDSTISFQSKIVEHVKM